MSAFRTNSIVAVTPLGGTAPSVGYVDDAQVAAWAAHLLGLGSAGGLGDAPCNPRVIFAYASDEADNQARTMTVYGLRRMRSGRELSGAELVKLWTLSWTLGTATGDNDIAHLPATFRAADTVTETSEDAYLTFLLELHDAANPLHSPADNTIAHAGISDLANVQALLFHVASLGAGNTAKVLAEVYR